MHIYIYTKMYSTQRGRFGLGGGRGDESDEESYKPPLEAAVRVFNRRQQRFCLLYT
jgi:hypothetical protein